ncbi:TM2 domain-containing protein [Anaerofustis sp. NSJ-163]|uniref:TM2 domain-containing protein n=1 Tax=Anaerofustis sp. NSJ-163 TaxID=2944391 RepID=UPI00209C56C5|nr:TM2 domain-containing protein [Anaerofustis sp. NSJ-163]MCO8193153.1 TM2 domain-containing protein [Anaerofustis sp. NSJ-163]
MEQNKVDMFLMSNAEYFPEENMMLIRERLQALPDECFVQLSTMQFKSPVVMLVVSLFVGGFGVDRMMLGEVGLGVLKLLTAGGCGIWTIIDWFMIMGNTKEKNVLKLMNAINMIQSNPYGQTNYNNQYNQYNQYNQDNQNDNIIDVDEQ